VPLVYDELRRMASNLIVGERPGQTLQATSLVHEAWLRVVGTQDRNWNNRMHFFRAAAQAMRRILVERARHKSRLRHGCAWQRLNIDDVQLADAFSDERILLIDEALSRLEKVDPESADHHPQVLRRIYQPGNYQNPEFDRTDRRTPMGLCEGPSHSPNWPVRELMHHRVRMTAGFKQSLCLSICEAEAGDPFWRTH